MSDLTRGAALKRLVGMAAMPATFPDSDEVSHFELRAVYQNMICLQRRDVAGKRHPGCGPGRAQG